MPEGPFTAERTYDMRTLLAYSTLHGYRDEAEHLRAYCAAKPPPGPNPIWAVALRTRRI